MVIEPRTIKGQVFIKFLWHHERYRTKGGVSPALAVDFKNKALQTGDIAESKVVTNKDLFNWINGSVIPKWAKLAAFELALENQWQPVDIIDVMTVLALDKDTFESTPLFELADLYRKKYKINFPMPVLTKIKNIDT